MKGEKNPQTNWHVSRATSLPQEVDGNPMDLSNFENVIY